MDTHRAAQPFLPTRPEMPLSPEKRRAWLDIRLLMKQAAKLPRGCGWEVEQRVRAAAHDVMRRVAPEELSMWSLGPP
eukprot:6139632-Alexandrium_andersonii.AAC.1